MVRLSVCLALVISSATLAHADDEGSEHSAVLVGAADDTIGVTPSFDPKTGWSMDVRPAPGAERKTWRLTTLPSEHAHYFTYVTPGRAAIVFIESSAGTSAARPKVTASDGLAWVYSPDGKLLRRFTYGEVLTKDELAKMRRSVSHMFWTEGAPVAGKSGLELQVGSTKRKVVLDTAAEHFR